MAVPLADPVDGVLLPDGVALGRVNAQHVRAGLHERGDALGIVAGVDARADAVALVGVLQGEGVLLVLSVVLAEDEVEQVILLVDDGQGVELVIPDDVVGLLQARRGGGGDELFARGHELTHRQVGAHARDAVVTARHDAEKLAVRGGVLGDGDGGEAVFLLQGEHIRERVVGREVRGAHDEAGLVRLDAAHHLGLALDGLGAIDEGQAALLGQGDGERVVRDGLHDGRNHGDVQAQRALLLPAAVAHERRFERHAVRDALGRGVAGDEKILAEGMGRLRIVKGHRWGSSLQYF